MALQDIGKKAVDLASSAGKGISETWKEARKNASDPTSTPLYNLQNKPSKYDNKYQVEQHSYPEDIEGHNDEYGYNYAVFYINVSEDSRLVKEQPELFVKDQPPRIVSESTAQVQNGTSGEADAYAIAPAAVKNTTGALGLGAIIGGEGGAATSKAGLALTTLGVGAVALSASNFQNKTRRLKTAIKLHMPNQLNIRYSANYQEEEVLDDALIGTLAQGGAAMLFGAENDAKDTDVKDLTNKFASGIAAAALSKDMAGGKMLQRLGRIAPNPRKEQLFKSVDVRTFQIDYQFFPRSPKEMQNVQNIIYELKYHMHPEYKDANAFLYVYPSEFDIVYYHGNQENQNIHKHTSCVLTELNVNYTPQGRFNSFAGGAPTQINVVMTFRELLPLTKETIKGGL